MSDSRRLKAAIEEKMGDQALRMAEQCQSLGVSRETWCDKDFEVIDRDKKYRVKTRIQVERLI